MKKHTVKSVVALLCESILIASATTDKYSPQVLAVAAGSWGLSFMPCLQSLAIDIQGFSFLGRITTGKKEMFVLPGHTAHPAGKSLAPGYVGRFTGKTVRQGLRSFTCW